MARLAEEICTKALNHYAAVGFRLYEYDDHTIVLEHNCGWSDKFTTFAQITAIQNDCRQHLVDAHGYEEDSI